MAAPQVFRFPTARATTIVGVAVTAVAVGAALFIPSRDFASIVPLVVAAAWIAWVLWGYPLIRIDDRVLFVRNSLNTVEIPLTAITEISGGAKLTIRTADRRTYVPAAAAGSGVSFFWQAQRAKDAYGDSIVPIKGVEVLRLDASRERTPASVIAQTIERRIASLEPSPGGLRAVPPPRINLDIVLVSLAILVGAVAFVVVLL